MGLASIPCCFGYFLDLAGRLIACFGAICVFVFLITNNFLVCFSIYSSLVNEEGP